MKDVLVRFAELSDLNWLAKKDDIKRAIIKRKIEQKEIIVARLNYKLIGFLRFEFLWSLVPHVAMIRVDEAHQKKGVGKSMIDFLEKYLVKKGHKLLFSSSQANELEPQRWHKKNGFKECGYIDNVQGVREIFLCKKFKE